MAIKLTETLTLEKDDYSWVLVEVRGPKASYNHKTYHATLEQVSRKLLMMQEMNSARDVKDLSITFNLVALNIKEMLDATVYESVDAKQPPKDRVKLGLSPSTIVEEIDCRGE